VLVQQTISLVLIQLIAFLACRKIECLFSFFVHLNFIELCFIDEMLYIFKKKFAENLNIQVDEKIKIRVGSIVIEIGKNAKENLLKGYGMQHFCQFRILTVGGRWTQWKKSYEKVEKYKRDILNCFDH
jgi:hypothetical protein